MEMDFLEALSLFLFSGVKLLITPMFAVFLPKTFPCLIEVAYVSSLGAIIGSIVFFFIGKGIDKIGTKKRKPGKKIFTKKNKRIIKIKNRFGLFVMSMTIGIISVPIGSILVGMYFCIDKNAIPTLIGASFIWSFGVTYITALIYNVLRPIFS